MSTVKIVRERGDYSPEAALEAAKKHPAYWQEDLLVTLADRLSLEMDSQGMSRAGLARKLGVSPAYVTKVLRGHENLTLKTLARIAFELGKRWNCLLTDLREPAGITIKRVHAIADNPTIDVLEMERARNRSAQVQPALVKESHVEYHANKAAAKSIGTGVKAKTSARHKADSKDRQLP